MLSQLLCLSQAPDQLSQQLIDTLTHNTSFFNASSQQQQQQQPLGSNQNRQIRPATAIRPSAAPGVTSSRGGGPSLKKNKAAGGWPEDNAPGPLSSPPPTTDPYAADIALRALARMVKGQGQAQGQGAKEVPPPAAPGGASSASLLSSLLSKPVATTTAFQMAASAGLVGGGGGRLLPFPPMYPHERPGLTFAASSSKPHESHHKKRSGIPSGGEGGGGGGFVSQSRTIAATLGDCQHVVVIYEDPEELGVGAEEGQGGMATAHVEEGRDEVGRPSGAGEVAGREGGDLNRLSSLKAVQDLSKIDVLAALAMFSMPASNAIKQ